MATKDEVAQMLIMFHNRKSAAISSFVHDEDDDWRDDALELIQSQINDLTELHKQVREM